MPRSAFESLDALAARLPFHIDDVASANDAFLRWRRTGSEADRRTVQLWTYCFIRRYFLVKFLQETTYGPADLDHVIDTAFRKAIGSSADIKNPGRYGHWVSKICKNTFLNYLRGRRRPLPLEDAPPLVGESPTAYNDPGLAHDALVRAIERLPDYLRDCARLRFLEEMSYEEIAARTGFPLPRIRSYVNKAVNRFREDDELLDFFDPNR